MSPGLSCSGGLDILSCQIRARTPEKEDPSQRHSAKHHTKVVPEALGGPLEEMALTKEVRWLGQ